MSKNLPEKLQEYGKQNDCLKIDKDIIKFQVLDFRDQNPFERKAIQPLYTTRKTSKASQILSKSTGLVKKGSLFIGP